ncbi:endonuclease III [Candidatus Borkfalkia ceftriaxoniphila]|uniref:Endonuclease III n=1 Tax=Candidatus Borkfalkia ceftriaxoniphila TaxID=2508949 RepID=A0A4Q2KBK1_9FIRM|nr:endonuclease III [Candidatus Borkfalkia ceftriaxoniphila]RXZ61955.1 endonuclease III [Candidatus Borkfalkia ceftriaxoniphila]
MNAKNAQQSLRILSELYKDARPALHYATAYELLIAVILSAQCTDERVNKVTAELFKEHNTPETMLLLSQEQLEKYIFSCGLYKSKAAHILSATKDIVERFGGQVPESFADLKSLAGVGQKTANVVSAVWFDKDAIAVDTHVFRVSNRLGLADANTPLKTEEQLKKVIPQKDWSKAHHWLIYHGRRVCHSQKPDCENCALREYCDYYKQK